MMPDLYEGFKNAIPTVITTITDKGWAFLWYENLMDKNMSFMCAHVFKPNHNDLLNDVSFLEYPVNHPEKYHDLVEKHSYIFNPSKNKLAMIKKSHNNLGVYQNSYEGTTFDWIFCLKNQAFEIFKAEGLRNFPIKNIKISSMGTIALEHRMMPKLHYPIQIFSVSCRDFNDKVSFYGINKSFQLIKYRRDLLQKSTRGDWVFKNILITKRDIITDIIVHPDYPIFLNKTITNELWFYIEEQSAKEIVKFNDFKYIGQYNHTKPVKQIVFINKIPGVIVLNQDKTMTIVCCDTFLKVLGSHKYSQEFLQIWDTKKNINYEKWILADEYHLVDNFGESVKGIQVLSTHFEQSEATVKLLVIYKETYAIYDIIISISSFKEFIVKIVPVSNKKLGFTVSKYYVSSRTELGRYHVLVKKKMDTPTTCLFKITLDSDERNDKMQVLWTSNSLKTSNVRTVLGTQYLGIINDDDHVLFIYDLNEERYSGYINLKQVIPDLNSNSKHIEQEYVSDMLFCRNHAKGSLVVYYQDSVLLFSQINSERLDSVQDESWTLINRFDNVLNLKNIKSVSLEESYYGKLLFIINNKYFLTKNHFLTPVNDHILGSKIANTASNDLKKVTFEGLFTLFQESKPIYHPQLLKQFFLKGHMSLVLKILIKFNDLLKLESKGYKVPSFCEFSLDMIVAEIKTDAKEAPKKEEVKKTKDTAASLFDTMFSWDNEEKDTGLFGKKKEEKKKEVKEKGGIEEEFDEIKDNLLNELKGKNSEKINLSEKSKMELSRFVKIFAQLYDKEFYSDKLTAALLRKFNFDKEYNLLLEKEKKEREEREREDEMSLTVASRILRSIKAEESNVTLEPWTTMQVAFAFHSKDQDVIYNQIKDDNIDWATCQKLSIPIWLKETEKLKQVVEGVAKTVYRRAADDVGLSSRAAVTAMWYIIINKKSMLCNLYRTEPANKKIHDLLTNNFEEDRWKKAADKNAMVLISKKNYELSIAFFILAGKINDAIKIALDKLKDLNLAILITRLVDGYDAPSTFQLIDKYLIEGGKDMDDPWLVSIGYWWKSQHFEAINTLSKMIKETNDRLSQ